MNRQANSFPIATFDDLKETLNLMKVGASGVRPYLVSWYNKVFVTAIKDLDDKPNEDKNENSGTFYCKGKACWRNYRTASGRKTKQVFGGTKPSSKELRDKYLYPLINQGVIDQVPSELDRRGNIYLHVEEGNLFSMFGDSTIANVANPKLKVPSPDVFPSKNFLKEQFRISLEKNADEGVFSEKNFSCYRLVDINGTEITLDQLLDKYFNNPDECFVKTEDKQQQYFFEKSSPDMRSNLSEIPKNDIEDYYYSCYYCDNFTTNNKGDYESHVINKHGLDHQCFPSEGKELGDMIIQIRSANFHDITQYRRLGEHQAGCQFNL